MGRGIAPVPVPLGRVALAVGRTAPPVPVETQVVGPTGSITGMVMYLVVKLTSVGHASSVVMFDDGVGATEGSEVMLPVTSDGGVVAL